MEQEARSLHGALVAAALDLGLALTEADTAALLKYLSLLARWNATYNLTSVRQPAEMLRLHVLDCLSVLGPLRRRLSSSSRVLDVGSGAGLPGAIIAILNPAMSVTCVDAVGKKAAFVQQVASDLRLANLVSRHSRVETLKDKFDLVISRAFASLADFTRLTEQQLAPGGVWVAMKGKTPAEEVAELSADVEVFHVEQIEVPGLQAQRCLVWMRQRRTL